MATLSNVNIGTSSNDGTGDDLRTAFTTVNTNFQALAGIFPNLDVADLTANITSTGTSTFNILNAATIGNVDAAIVGGSVNAATIGNSGASLVGTISTAAQPTITSLGTLSALTVSGPLTINGAVNHNIVELGSNIYTLLDSDNTIVANLASLGNCVVTLPNSANNSGRSITVAVYDPSNTANLELSAQVNPGEGNIFITANFSFSSTGIGVDYGVNHTRLTSVGQYWIRL